MALTFGQLTDQILAETFRDVSFSTFVQNAIVSAIKELEIQELFINQKFAVLNVPQTTDANFPGLQRIDLPTDFISVLMVNFVINNTVVPNPPNIQVFTEADGFKEVTFYQLQLDSYSFLSYNTPANGLAYNWALYGNQIWISPTPIPANPPTNVNYQLDLFYYYRDPYPVNTSDTSIWLGDFTQDVTRYTARGIFYRDVLQSPELAASDFAKAQDALQKLKLRNSQRETINTLSF